MTYIIEAIAMGMSSRVVGFAPPDEQWQRMKAVYDACQAANITAPDDVLKFFGWQQPDPAGVEIDIPVSEYSKDMEEGFELRVSDIPAHVTVIRFLNSY